MENQYPTRTEAPSPASAPTLRIKAGDVISAHCIELEAAELSHIGLLVRRALQLINVLALGIRVSMRDMRANELLAAVIIRHERDTLARA